MKDFCETTPSSEYFGKNFADSPNRIGDSISSEAELSSHQFHKPSVWSGFLGSAFSVFESYSEAKSTNQVCSTRNYGWSEAMERVMNSGSMRRILGLDKIGISNSKSDIWLLGICYKITQHDFTDPTQSEGFASFVEDFSSRILITYRKGFAPIEDTKYTKYTSDASWGCMVRCSQMLIAQALLFCLLGRSWRKNMDQPVEETYIRILHLFGDSESSPYSLHNLLQAGKVYGLSPGSWVGPYAMCRAWETLARGKEKKAVSRGLTSMITIYVVSGDEDGERGGAPVVCVEDITRHCFDYSRGQIDWTPVVLLVPLVLGLDKVNPRYLPLLRATFCFPQSLGILGGRPGASTYVIGMQDDEAFYLDPHEVQQVVDITEDNLDVDTSSYHSNTLRHFPLDSIDPSLAIGFYCRDKRDFDDFCSRASELADQSNGAPLFTVTETRGSLNPVSHHDNLTENARFPEPGSFESVSAGETEDFTQDDWQLL